MKKIKLLLTIPAFTAALIPLVSCGNKDSDITLTLESEKTQETQSQSGLIGVRYVFMLNKEVALDKITYKTTEHSSRTTDVTTKLTQDGKELSFYVIFNNPEPGDYYSFDIEFNIDGKIIKFEGLKALFVQENAPIPEKALLINDETNELEGLNPSFEITSDFTALKIPDRIESIKAGAFKNAFATDKNSTIRTITLNSNLKTIGDNAFDGCNRINTLDVSKVTVTNASPITIGTDAFANWTTGGTIKYAQGSTSYNELDCALCDAGLPVNWFADEDRAMPTSDFMIEDTTIANLQWASMDTAPKHISLIKKVIIPDGITDIGPDVFYDKGNTASRLPSNITTLKLPDSLITIGENAFNKAPFNIFINDIGAENTLVLPQSLTTIGANAFSYNKMLAILFNAKLTTVGAGAFYNCSNTAVLDATELTSVPSGWSTSPSTFNFGSSSSGLIYCKPALAQQWKTYFQNAGITFGENKWYLKEDITLVEDSEVKPYSPAVAPLEGYEYKDKAEILMAYRNHLNYTPIIVDDAVYTLHDNVATAFNFLEVAVGTATYSDDDGLCLTISYSAILADDPNTQYDGKIAIDAFNIKDSTKAIVTPDTTKEILSCKFSDFFGASALEFAELSIKEVTTVDGTSTLKKYTYDYSNQPTDVTENELGKVISKLGMFSKEQDGKIYFNINSHYMGKCWIKK